MLHHSTPLSIPLSSISGCLPVFSPFLFLFHSEVSNSETLSHHHTTWAVWRLWLCCWLPRSQNIKAVSAAKAVRGSHCRKMCVCACVAGGWLNSDSDSRRPCSDATAPMRLLVKHSTLPRCHEQLFLLSLPCPSLLILTGLHLSTCPCHHFSISPLQLAIYI